MVQLLTRPPFAPYTLFFGRLGVGALMRWWIVALVWMLASLVHQSTIHPRGAQPLNHPYRNNYYQCAYFYP